MLAMEFWLPFLYVCQAQPQLQLQLWLRLALILISPATPPLQPPKNYFSVMPSKAMSLDEL